MNIPATNSSVNTKLRNACDAPIGIAKQVASLINAVTISN